MRKKVLLYLQAFEVEVIQKFLQRNVKKGAKAAEHDVQFLSLKRKRG